MGKEGGVTGVVLRALTRAQPFPSPPLSAIHSVQEAPPYALRHGVRRGAYVTLRRCSHGVRQAHGAKEGDGASPGATT